MREVEMKLVKVATAPDQLMAEMWQELLRAEGISAMFEPRGVVSFMGLSAMPCGLLVPEEMLEDAEAILQEYVVGS